MVNYPDIGVSLRVSGKTRSVLKNTWVIFAMKNLMHAGLMQPSHHNIKFPSIGSLSMPEIYR
jgi:hypothetical protein